jgi:hypothetical protein
MRSTRAAVAAVTSTLGIAALSIGCSDMRDEAASASGAGGAGGHSIAGSGGGGMVGAGGDPMAGRVVQQTVTLDANGVSSPLEFVVPGATRSVTVVAVGAETALYALGAFQTADGIEHVGVSLDGPLGPSMEARYFDEQIGLMEGGLYQSIRLGTFTHVYPYAPDLALPAGSSSLRITSNAASGDVDVTLLMPEDDGASVLHLSFLTATEGAPFAPGPSLLDPLQAIFATAGITVVVDEVLALPGTGLEDITEFTEPQETPQSQSAMLALLGHAASPGSTSLKVIGVDSLPAAGLSLGTPGPPIPSSYYFGVIIDSLSQTSGSARVVAHEVSHFLALSHVTNSGISGTTYPDPLDDTVPGDGNLMESGTVLTPDQAFALSRSALLRKE